MDKILYIRMYISTIHMYILCIIVVLNVSGSYIKLILKKNNKKRYFENLIHISISTNIPG